MGMKKLLTFTFIISALLITGCSNKSINSIETSYDEATYQKTMTKVQNNVNEIIGKEYKYVLDNMGNPYCTRYYIDNDKINKAAIIATTTTFITFVIIKSSFYHT